MDSKSVPIIGAGLGLIMSAGGAGGFLDVDSDRRYWPIARERDPGYDATGRKLNRSAKSKKAVAKKKASKKARKATRRG